MATVREVMAVAAGAGAAADAEWQLPTENCKESEMRSWYGIVVVGSIIAANSGCGPTDYNGKGIIYGCDGSGAGVVVRWGPPARQGVINAGFKGVFRPFRWQTGLGVAADHDSSVEYKRATAQKLANEIGEHCRKYPDDPVYLGGLSAGCAVVIFAIEELPPGCMVDQVFLLSSSVSATYDLTRMLQRVRGKVIVCTSSRDEVLKGLVALVGTADRQMVGMDISGLIGFRPPPGASTETRSLYQQKIATIAWRPEFAQYGHHGGHTDVVATDFIAKFIGPHLVPGGRR